MFTSLWFVCLQSSLYLLEAGRLTQLCMFTSLWFVCRQRSLYLLQAGRVMQLCMFTSLWFVYLQRSLYLLEAGRLTRLDPVELRRRESVPLPSVQSGSRWFSDGAFLCSMAPQQDVSFTRQAALRYSVAGATPP